MTKITKQMLVSKGLQEPQYRLFCNYTGTYSKLWEVGDFNVRLSGGKLQVFDTINDKLIKVIVDESVLDAFLIFARA